MLVVSPSLKRGGGGEDLDKERAIIVVFVVSPPLADCLGPRCTFGHLNSVGFGLENGQAPRPRSSIGGERRAGL